MRSQLFKSVLCLLTALVIIFPLGGCGKDQPTYEDGHYVTEKGEIIEDQEVTLDVIALTHYQKKFDKLSKEEDRRVVISKYLEYHLPAEGEKQLVGKAELIKQLSEFDLEMPDIYGNQLGTVEDIISKASTALSLAEIYGEIKNNKGFKEFIGDISEDCEVVDLLVNFSRACYIVSDLATNDVNDRQAYCSDIIDGLSLITSNIPIFDEYFTQTLEIVKTGMKELIKSYTAHETHLGVLAMEIEEGTFFSAHNFEWILIPDRWKFRSAPSIELILKNDDLFDTIPRGPITVNSKKDPDKDPEKDPEKDPYEYFKKYILDRVRREVTNDFEPEDSSTQTETSGSTGTSSNSGTTPTPNKTPNTSPELPKKPDIEPNPHRTPCAEDKHSWKSTKVLKQPTCIEEGIDSMTCANCWATMEKPIAKVDHAYEEEVIPPTTEKMGYSLFTCKVCGKFYRDKITDPLPSEPTPRISGAGNWYGEGRREHSKTGFFKLRIDSVSESSISGYLDVYTIVLGNQKTVHQTTFTGTGQATEDGYVYLLKFDQSVTFGVVPAYTCTEMKLYYKSEKDIYAFEGLYEVVMKRT